MMKFDMTPTEVKVQDLAGAALDWATVMAKGGSPALALGGTYGKPGSKLFVQSYGHPCQISTDWQAGGPLLEQFDICFNPLDCTPLGITGFAAYSKRDPLRSMSGDTHLQAACRLVVLNAYGTRVFVPKALADVEVCV
jgi:hypothetical protein